MLISVVNKHLRYRDKNVKAKVHDNDSHVNGEDQNQDKHLQDFSETYVLTGVHLSMKGEGERKFTIHRQGSVNLLENK